MKLITGIILAFLLGTMFFSLFQMSSGMDMGHGMKDCPFMAHESVICPMDLADHIGAWKGMFLAVVPTLLLLLAIAGGVGLLVTLMPNLLLQRRDRLLAVRTFIPKPSHSYPRRPLQELFSRGILHPKLF